MNDTVKTITKKQKNISVGDNFIKYTVSEARNEMLQKHIASPTATSKYNLLLTVGLCYNSAISSTPNILCYQFNQHPFPTIVLLNRLNPQSVCVLENINPQFFPHIKVVERMRRKSAVECMSGIKLDKLKKEQQAVSITNNQNFIFKEQYSSELQYCMTFIDNATVTINGKPYQSGAVLSAAEVRKAKVSFNDVSKGGNLILLSNEKPAKGLFWKAIQLFDSESYKWSIAKAVHFNPNK